MSESPAQIVRSVAAAFLAALVVFPFTFVFGLYLITIGSCGAATVIGMPTDLRETLALAFWPLLVLLNVLVAAFVSHRVYRRLIPRRASEVPECESCGYNLTCNVSGRCPECGTELQCANDISSP